MVIYNKMELTKNEILATIYVLVVCFDMDLPIETRLVGTISAENLKPNNSYGK